MNLEDTIYLVEAAAHIVCGGFDQLSIHNVKVAIDVDGLIGSHRTIEGGKYHLHYNRFVDKMRRFDENDVPIFEKYQQLKHKLVEAKRDQMRLAEFKPKVMSSFVRNKLLNNVYLPMIGDNFI